MKGIMKQIRLTAEDVCEFVAVANLCEFPVQLATKSCRVNAKNLGDMFLLDFSQLYEVVYNGYDRVFEKYLNRIAVA